MTNFPRYPRSFLLAALGAAALSTAVPVAFTATAYGSHGAVVHVLSRQARAASHVGATPAGNAHLQSTGLRRLQAPEKAKTVNLIGRHVVHLSIHNLAFGPARIKVSLHTRIVWTNNDPFQHTVTSDTGVWDSGNVDPSANYNRTFNKTGTFKYHCTIHPFMLGSVTVVK